MNMLTFYVKYTIIIIVNFLLDSVSLHVYAVYSSTRKERNLWTILWTHFPWTCWSSLRPLLCGSRGWALIRFRKTSSPRSDILTRRGSCRVYWEEKSRLTGLRWAWPTMTWPMWPNTRGRASKKEQPRCPKGLLSSSLKWLSAVGARVASLKTAIRAVRWTGCTDNPHSPFLKTWERGIFYWKNINKSQEKSTKIKKVWYNYCVMTWNNT